MHEVIPLMNIVWEFKEQGMIDVISTPKVHCKASEDNSGALKIAQLPKMRPRTKHLNYHYHHSREHVMKGDVDVLPIATEDQQADLFMKPLGEDLFLKFCKLIIGW